MKSEKLIESWKDALCLIILIALGLGIIYICFFTPNPESVCTTGSGKELEAIFKEFIKSLF